MTNNYCKDIPLEDINIHGGTQPRAEINQEVVAEYKTAFEIGAGFPPAEVFYDGTAYWLADGFHRYHAAKQSKQDTLDCRVHNGTQRDAVLFSCGANSSHGLRRTNEDKRRAVFVLLKDAEWGKWSSREIAERCSVSHTLVNESRQTMEDSSVVSEVQFKTKNGHVATRTVPARSEKPKPAPETAESATPKPGIASDPDGDRAAAIMKAQKSGKASREPGDESENEPQAFKNQRSKTIKTVEALMRAFDDLHGMQSHRLQHADAIASCKILLKTAKDWSCK